MTTEVLTSLLTAIPFEPFRVCISDGKELEVRHPDYVQISPGKGHVMIYTSPERFQLVDAKHITRLEPMGALAHP
jgi:type IV secretory pathway ATPase VirB11/archaellum biosynthesis ATPase